MLRVLIVDDDKIISEDLSLLIKWEEQGFNLIGDAGNGIEALSMIRKYNVDIVITDISMPRMDGIELIKRCQQLEDSPKILVVSNYDDFKFVKDALKNGAIDYLLKYEINEINLLEQLNNIKNILLNEEKQIKLNNKLTKFSAIGIEASIKDYFYDLLTKNGEVSINPLSNDIKLLYDSFSYGVIGVKWNGKNHDDEMIFLVDTLKKMYHITTAINDVVDRKSSHLQDIFWVKVDDNTYFLLNVFVSNSYSFIISRNHEIAKMIVNNSNKKEQNIYSVCVGEVCQRSSKLYDVFTEINDIFDISFYNEKLKIITNINGIKIKNEFDLIFFSNIEEEIVNDVLENREAFPVNFNKLFEHFNSMYYKAELVRFYLIHLIDEIQIKTKISTVQLNDFIGNRAQYTNEINSFSNLIDIKRWLFDRLSLFINKNQEYSYKELRPEIRKALIYISDNYMRQITLEDIADNVGLSRNHFCRIFKSEVKNSFVSHVNKVRINKAIYIMKQTNKKVNQVAIEVGFSDYRYFCKVFKSETGMNPTEYKKIVQLE